MGTFKIESKNFVRYYRITPNISTILVFDKNNSFKSMKTFKQNFPKIIENELKNTAKSISIASFEEKLSKVQELIDLQLLTFSNKKNLEKAFLDI
jgi:hypothetical protein